MDDRHPDLDPAGVALLNALGAVHTEHLDLPTPCRDWPVSVLIAHLDELTKAFADSAAREFGPWTDNSPAEREFVLADGWSTRLPRHVQELVLAWHRPGVWEGETRIGGIDQPAEQVGLAALTEVVLHGWDLSRAIDVPYEPDEATARAVLSYLESLGDAREAAYGPAVQLPENLTPRADTLDHALALSGRDPEWPGPVTRS